MLIHVWAFLKEAAITAIDPGIPLPIIVDLVRKCKEREWECEKVGDKLGDRRKLKFELG